MQSDQTWVLRSGGGISAQTVLHGGCRRLICRPVNPCGVGGNRRDKHSGNHRRIVAARRILPRAQIEGASLRAGISVDIGGDRRQSHSAIDCGRTGLQVEIVGRRIHELGVDTGLVGAHATPGGIRHDAGHSVNQVVVEGAGDRGGIPRHGVAVGAVEDIVADVNAGIAPPEHDLPGFPVGIPVRERVVGDQPVAGSIGQLDRPAPVHVVEDVVDDGHVIGMGIDPMVEVELSLTRGAADVVKDVAVESEVVFRGVQIDPVAADLIGHGTVSDVTDFVPFDGDVMGAVVTVDAFIAAALNHEALDDDEGRAVQIEVGAGAIAACGGAGVHGVQNGSTTVLSFEGNGVPSGTAVGKVNDVVGRDHAFVIVSAVHHDDRVARLGRYGRGFSKVAERSALRPGIGIAASGRDVIGCAIGDSESRHRERPG